MSATLTNGTRKSLADQLDRFDAMLDGLAEAIPDAVADAVRAAVAVAVREAVQSAVAEVLTNPEVLARIREAGTPPAAPTVATEPACPACRAPSRLGLWCAAARARCGEACAALSERYIAARAWAGEKVELACRWRKPVLGGLGAGVTVALAAYLFGPLAGSLLCAASVSALVVVAAALASKHASPPAN
jgi:VIT1/CCC1 family predicted Fe2+/Mn2+ transporter